MLDVKKEKVLGALYGAAYGDSFGAITEFCSKEKIRNAFPNGYTAYANSISHITNGIEPGCVTDDFGSSLYVMETILKHAGQFDRTIATEAILNWSEDSVVFSKYAGENSKAAIVRLKTGVVIDEVLKRRMFIGANTNGAAMRACPVGLLARGNLSLACEYASILSWPTHYNAAAVSGAAAIACAVTESQKEEADLSQIYDAAIYGAEMARKSLEKEGFGTFGPYMEVRIGDAVEAGMQVTNAEECIEMLDGKVGTGISVQESVAAVFAAIAANKGDFYKTLFCTANAGGDTDTISSMAGAILGGLHGVQSLRKEDIERINTVNSFLDLEETVNQFTELINRE